MEPGFDLAVVGAGAAGVMACHAALRSRSGIRLLLLEKERNALRKFKITGKGRCNLTTGVSPGFFFQELGRGGKFLRSAWSRFDAAATLEFFHSIGVETVEERGQRIFPRSQSSFQTALSYFDSLPKDTLCFRCSSPLRELVPLPGGGFRLAWTGGEARAKRVVLTTGGITYPVTGSDGSGLRLLAALGHRIVPPRHALCGMICHDPDGELASLSGLSLRNVTVSLWQEMKKRQEAFGEALFTGNGLSGPTVLTLSRSGRDCFHEDGRAKNAVELRLDFKPALDEATLDARLCRDLAEHPTRRAANALAAILPGSIRDLIFRRAGLPTACRAAELPRTMRRALVRELKGFRLPLQELDSPERAVITLGGVDRRDVQPHTLESKLLPGLFLAGELLDLDGPTGGYNLQIAFTTGWVAGTSAVESLP